jgi:hypothetical protein
MAGPSSCQLPDPLHHPDLPSIQVVEEIFPEKASRSRSIHSGTTKKALCDVYSLDPFVRNHSGKYS